MIFKIFKKKITPFNSGFLPEQDGHRVSYCEFGKRDGQPILCFHGGPGYRSHFKQARLFDLKKYRVVLFDQRGCGQSLPKGELRHNTTQHTLHDAQRLIDLLGLENLYVYGNSWGSTLALLFAEQHPDRVKKLMIAKTFLARPRDVDWMAGDTRLFYPDLFAQMENAIPAGRSVRAHYAALALSENPAEQAISTRLFGRFESQIGRLQPVFPNAVPTKDEIENYRIYMHYDHHDYFIAQNQILDQITRLTHIPLLILHNRLDMVCPVEQSWLVHKALPHSKLVIVPDAGHSSPLLSAVSKKEIAKFLRHG